MKILTSSLLVFGMALAGPGPSLAQAPTGDAVAGHRLAVAGCSACHAVGPMMAGPPMGARSFAEIANQPNTTSYRIRIFLRSSHTTMPNYVLSPEEIDNLTAYIMSFRRKQT